jgi:SAM-dependent methyltransferase
MAKIDQERFSGFADLYDEVRPRPPRKVVDVILGIKRSRHLDCAVDLGSGTGLSTSIWGSFSDKVIGIEPTGDMRRKAADRYPDIEFIDASSYETTVETASVDVVTCSQSFHWMEPTATLKEADRILKFDGLFAAYDCVWPVTWNHQAEMAYRELLAKAQKMVSAFPDLEDISIKYPKERHLENIEKSGYFRYANQVFFDNTEPCDADRFIRIALSQGSLQSLIKKNVDAIAKEIDSFRKICERLQGNEMRVSYLLNYGIK